MRPRRRTENKVNNEAVNLEFRKHLWEAGKSANENTDKAILTLSAGALALSMTFLKDIVPLKDVIELPLIIAAWCAFGSSIACVLFSLYESRKAIDVQLQRLESQIAGDHESASLPNPHIERTNRLNLVAGALFFTGLILTILFTTFNVKRYSEMNNKIGSTNGNRGYAPAQLPSTPKPGAGYAPAQLPSPSAGQGPSTSPPPKK
ncbi:hypothetical protein OR1_00654 [Geobacter sp. OR-1]|uniref:hypothetical protein n=1 Tax=Geobacter sp. OR-1 TaxID=1266765 RepID=UPI0005427A35|nr:hypothetical protein [Geobacter sp. OR-1]GAM08383.1 hypothetical protein OR1_00654 [Geobacter sp. OR-1]